MGFFCCTVASISLVCSLSPACDGQNGSSFHFIGSSSPVFLAVENSFTSNSKLALATGIAKHVMMSLSHLVHAVKYGQNALLQHGYSFLATTALLYNGLNKPSARPSSRLPAPHLSC
jgi:hypothetical protein